MTFKYKRKKTRFRRTVQSENHRTTATPPLWPKPIKNQWRRTKKISKKTRKNEQKYEQNPDQKNQKNEQPKSKPTD